MKKLLIGLTLLTSLSSFATEYLCVGLDSGYAKVEAREAAKSIGSLGGNQVSIADDGFSVTLTIQNGSLETSASAESGPITLQQKSGDKVSSVECAFSL